MVDLTIVNDVNRTALKLLGTDSKEVAAKSLKSIIAEDSMELLKQALISFTEGQTSFSGEGTYITLQGEKRHMFFRLSVPEAYKDTFERVIVSVIDITKRVQTEQSLERTTIGVLKALSRTVEAKDEYTDGHIIRVEDYAQEIGNRLGLSEERLEQLRYASELHDVGKVQVPDSILGKEAGLTDEEWEEIKKHPKIGAEIVGEVPRLQRAARIIAQHQEKFGGTGYPEGLEGEDITLEARIIAVVDAWDAMRTDRPYRDAIPRDEAIRELKKNAGSQFDPRVVREFLDFLEEKEPDKKGK